MARNQVLKLAIGESLIRVENRSSSSTMEGSAIMLRAANRVSCIANRFHKKCMELNNRKELNQIRAILSDPTPPDLRQSEQSFEMLQNCWPNRPEYGYDIRSLWGRAVDRSIKLIALDGMGVSGKSVLDIGAGDGVLGVVLNGFGYNVTLTDLEDWRHDLAKNLPFDAADCCTSLPYEDSSFDLVCSFNSFEHFPTPDTAFHEVIRVTKPNGLIFIEFGPLYCSPWGLHAYRMMRMPYPQFLFSEKFITAKLEETGIWDLGKKRLELQFLNKWKVSEFDDLWTNGGEVLTSQRTVDTTGLSIVSKFPSAFTGRNLTYDDLVVSALSVTIRKE